MNSKRWTHTLHSGFLRMLLAASLIVLLAGLPQHRARAASIRLVKVGGAVTGACLIWVNACSLWYAINVSVAGDEIWVAQGTHFPSASLIDRTKTIQLKTGVTIYGGFPLGATSMTERDPAAHVTILSGEIGLSTTPADNAYHVVTGSGVDNTAVLDGFTITLGYANGLGANQTLGAGLFIINGSPTLRNIIFSNHTATEGGAVYNSGGSPVFDRVTFLNNTSSTASGNGAALWNGNNAAPTLTNVTFTGGDAGGSGGGIYNDHSSPILNNVTFNNNVAASGGAMANVNASAPTVRNSILWGDSAASDPEIHNLDTSTASVTYSVVEGGYTGTGNTAADPLLGMLGNYGGSLQLFPLQDGSSAIDAADNATCAPVDGRGIIRPQGPRCDMGAFEVIVSGAFKVFLPLITK